MKAFALTLDNNSNDKKSLYNRINNLELSFELTRKVNKKKIFYLIFFLNYFLLIFVKFNKILRWGRPFGHFINIIDTLKKFNKSENND